MRQTFSPRIIGEQRADFTNIETFLNFKKFKGKDNEELILAIYDYLTSKIDGSYHWWDMEENKGVPTIKGRVIDPVKLFNVYGFQICGQMAGSLYRIYTTAGYKARVFGAPGHTISEVFYEGEWHFLDVDMWTWFKNKNNKIASAYELSKDAFQLIVENTNKSNPCNLPDRSLKGYAEMFHELKTENGDIDTVAPEYSVQGHTMDFHLRPGESMTRSNFAQGRYHLPDRFKPMIQKCILRNEWKGHPCERYEPFRTYGNGNWIYEPNLTSDYSDFLDGVWDYQNINPGKFGLEGNGYSIFRINSPYVFCGVPRIENNTIYTSDGAFISVKGKGEILLEISDVEDEWQIVQKFIGDFSEKIDITELLDGRYSCLIRFSQKSDSILNKFRFEAYTMTAPMSIPRLVKGENKFELNYCDKNKSETVPYHVPIDFRENKSLSNQIHSLLNGEIKVERPGWLGIYQKDLHQKLQVTFKIKLPNNKKSVWCYFFGVFKETVFGSQSGYAQIEYSFDDKVYRLAASRQITQSKMYWDCNLEGEIIFEKPISEVYFRLTSDTNISGFHCFHHIEEKRHLGQLHIAHQFDDGLVEKVFEAPIEKNKYTINCDNEPKNHSIRMFVKSLKRS